MKGKSQRQNAGDPAGEVDGRRGLGSCVGLVPAPRGASVWDFAAPQRGGVRLYPLLPAEDVRRNER